MPFIEHATGSTYFQTRGSKRSAGLPIVCLHGGPGGHSHFLTDLFQLSNQRRVFIYDQIGSGRSSATEKKHWNIRTFVRELETLVDAWGLDRFHLEGGSWGTTLALEYYLKGRNRRRVESLIFQSPMFSTSDWEKDARALIRDLPAADQKVIRYCHEIGATDSKVYQGAMKNYYAKHVCRNPARAKRAALIRNPNGNRIYEHMWGDSEFHATGTLKHYDRVNDLELIECPTLLICGQYDEARPATAKRYTRRIKDARFVEIPRASHAILAEQPRRFIRTVRHFLSEVEN